MSTNSEIQFSTESVSEFEQLSKTKQKKLRRYEKMVAGRKERRKADQEKKRKRRAEARAKGEELGPSRKALKEHSMATSNCKIRVAVDMAYDHLMVHKDIVRAVQQLSFCYAANRRAENPMQLYFVNLAGKSKEIFERPVDRQNWDVNCSELEACKLFGKENIVYLSSDSDNVLSTLSEDKVYVIGGLVDHNAHKGVCHRLAEEQGIQHARLPIDEFVEMKTRKVLTINHVFEIMLQFYECNDWRTAFFNVIPKRKGVGDKTAAI